MKDALLQPGFAHPGDSQLVFRQILDAMSHPGRIVTLNAEIAPPPSLSIAAAAILLALADATVGFALPPESEPAADWLTFHTGARPATIETADFVLAATLPRLDRLRPGTDAEPEASATLLLDLPAFGTGARFRLTGPGIEHTALLHAPLGRGFADAWRANRARAPRGIDLMLCAGARLIALPRSVTIEDPRSVTIEDL